MFSSSQHSRHVVRTVATIAAVLAVTVLSATTSSARPDPGPTVTRGGRADACLLERVGSQFVRCDDLTGNGVPAPAFIAER